MAAKLTRVFIAEDSPTTRLMLKAVLQRASDMECIGEAEDGGNVIERVSALKPDVVLMDVGLQGMDGLEATKKLKERYPELRVIMVTSNESDGVIFNAFSSGADGYYLKTNNGDQLLPAIRSVVNGAAWLHPAIAGRVLRSCVRGADKLIESKGKQANAHHANGAFDSHVSKHDAVSRLVSMAQEAEQNEKLDDCDVLMDGATALCEKLNNAEDLETASIITLHADMLYGQEKFQKAEKLYAKALDLRHQSLGYEHPDVAAALENLANLYDTRSNYAEAEHYYFWSLKIREKICPNDPLASDTCAKLAWVYRAQGKIDLAEEMEQRASKKK